ncbi:MAG: benzoyl-CoA 2,3-epoxidase subunit BoxB [Deltaproteobacteria bacterium]|nr:benzoyl-CoA 2,3-epoxidase subunit BoxB [Deltaproteobacteria bacterium]
MLSQEKIPNNVNLSSDRRLIRALEAWQPSFIEWWKTVGPEGFQLDDVYLRTAVSVEPDGWAHFDYVKMPDYRWGIFLSPPEEGRTVGFGDHLGEPAWQEVPGEHRNMLRRIVVTQADTEPASVEQQRLLGRTAPSLYDLRNLFQVNVEEGRHLWAMVYLLHTYFGRDGREEAEALLQRRSGDPDKPRILGAFNQPVENWLDFYMFTMFTDRDGKYQLAALKESGFDPLSRSCRFMLTEEAHHMFVGETGVDRILARTCELMTRDPNQDARAQGGVDLLTVQKYINLWFTLSIDLFGGEVSSNAADFFAAGLKGRYKEERHEDHRALDGVYPMEIPREGALVRQEVPLRNAMNEILRDNYIEDCQRAVDKWNRTIEASGVTSFRLRLPSRRFHRQIGIFTGLPLGPDGAFMPNEEWERKLGDWLPTEADVCHVKSLMHPVRERGKVAHWIAPPQKGINGTPLDFEYVRRN